MPARRIVTEPDGWVRRDKMPDSDINGYVEWWTGPDDRWYEISYSALTQTQLGEEELDRRAQQALVDLMANGFAGAQIRVSGESYMERKKKEGS